MQNFLKILTNIGSKKKGKTREIFFEYSQESREQKNGRKNWREIFFEDSHKYHEQKNGGKKTRDNFLKILTNITKKKWREKYARKIFYNHNNVECKKMKFKKRTENFLVSHECRKQKNGVKNA